eukprot:8836155-Pyramimonas_sp.AAC.1
MSLRWCSAQVMDRSMQMLGVTVAELDSRSVQMMDMISKLTSAVQSIQETQRDAEHRLLQHLESAGVSSGQSF